MKNTLLVKEIREMLDEGLYDEIKDFTESNPPDVVANFFEALNIDEIIKIFSFIDEEISAEIYSAFEDEVKIQLAKQLPSRELAELLYELPESMHNQIFSILPEEERGKIRELITKVDSEEQLKQEAQFANVPGIIRDSEGTIHENIRVYKHINKKLKQINRLEKDSLVTVVDPDQEEIDFLCSELKISPDFFDYSLDWDERARIEDDEKNKLVIIKVPYLDSKNPDEMYGTIPLGIIFADNAIVLVCNMETVLVTKMMERLQKNCSLSFSKDNFMLSVLYDTTQLFLLYLKQISNIINIVQKKVQDTSKNEDVVKLLNLEKSLVYFTTALKSNEFMIMKLKKSGIIAANEKNDDEIDDIIIESKQGIEMSSIYNNILSEIIHAISSIINNKLNNIMKLLASLTIIISIPSLLSSIYGMNFAYLPLKDSPNAFSVFIIVSLAISGLVVWFFKKINWL